jgi:hypothetical protein
MAMWFVGIIDSSSKHFAAIAFQSWILKSKTLRQFHTAFIEKVTLDSFNYFSVV